MSLVLLVPLCGFAYQRTSTHPIFKGNDEFNGDTLGSQWQWHADPQDGWFSFAERRGRLSLTAVPWPENAQNLWTVPNLLLKDAPASGFTATALVDASHLRPGERSGLLMMGSDYTYIAVVKTTTGVRVVHVVCKDAPKGTAEKENQTVELKSRVVYLRVSVVGVVISGFSYSLDGKRFRGMDDVFVVNEGNWSGAKVGLFALGPRETSRRGHADYEWFRFLPPR